MQFTENLGQTFNQTTGKQEQTFNTDTLMRVLLTQQAKEIKTGFLYKATPQSKLKHDILVL